MKNAFIIFFIFVVAITTVYFYEESQKEVERSMTYEEEGEIVKVFDEDGDVFFKYSIEDFRDWAEENWSDIFEKPPSFGDLREVDFNNFYRFDEVGAISPDLQSLAFSVSDYAAATNISFVGVVDLKEEDVQIIDEKNTGKVKALLWSPDSDYIVYSLNTARAEGDYLSIDNIKKMEKEFVIGGSEIIDYFQTEEEVDDDLSSSFVPRFREVEWIESNKLKFVTDHYEDDSDLTWYINTDKELELQ